MSTSVSLLAFDYGDKRIGIAHYNGEEVMPLEYIATEEYQDKLDAIIHSLAPQALVVGLPRTLEGEDTHQTMRAKAFASSLAEQTGLTLHLQDEALSSERASKLLPPKLTVKQQRQRIDSLAASIILQDYLDEKNAAL